MPNLYPELEPYASGQLEVGNGHTVYWEACGNPTGKPAVFLHGGPGAPCTPNHRRFFDPKAYNAILLDQRNCGRSTPHACTPDVDLSTNTTQDLVDDLERLRRHLSVDRWLVLGGSWGTTLGLAYAEAHPHRVTELVLFSVCLGLYREFVHVFGGGLAQRFPVQWCRLRDALHADRDENVVEAAHRLLFDGDAAVRERAAYEWCVWESSILEWPPSASVHPICGDAEFVLGFARIVTHYARNKAWLADGVLLEGIASIAATPTVLINGRHDPQISGAAERLARRLPLAELIIVEDAGHSASHSVFASEVVRATDRFATS